MEANKTIKATFSLPENQVDGLWQLFEHNLGFHQYRSFTNDKMVITVFKDNGIVRTGSTCFKIAGLDTSITTPNLATRTNLPEEAPLLSLNDIQILKNISHEGLQKLAFSLGKSTSKLISLFLLSFRWNK